MNKIYSMLWNANINGGGAVSNQSFINNYNRSWYLKSIFFDVIIKEALTQILVPIEQNIALEYNLQIRANPGQPNITSAFEDCTPVVNISNNGLAINIFKVGQIMFLGFEITAPLLLMLTIINKDAAKAFTYRVSCIIEIEEIKLRYAR